MPLESLYLGARNASPELDDVLLNLKYLASVSADRGNRMHREPWLPSPAWTAGEVVIIGCRRVSDNSVWGCITAGTCGSTAPSGIPTDTFLDNNVRWEYLGPNNYPTALPNGPTFSWSTTSPTATLNKFFTNAASTWTHGATVALKNDSWYNLYGLYNGLTTNGIGDYANSRGSIGFWTDAPVICLAVNGYSSSQGTYIEINGRMLMDSIIVDGGSATAGLSGGVGYMTINMPTTPGPHFVRIWHKTTSGALMRGIFTSAKYNCWADKSLSSRIKVSVVSDSQGECELYHGCNFDRTLQNVACEHLGFYNVYSDPVSGSGFYSGGTNAYGSDTRAAKIAGNAPHLIITWNSNNDTGQTQSSLQTAFDTWYNKVRTTNPDAYIIVTGQMNRTSAETTIDGFMRQIVTAKMVTDNRIRWVNTSNDPSGPWQTGTGYLSSPQNNGNSDLLTGRDGLHYSQRGKEVLGKRMADAIRDTILSW